MSEEGMTMKSSGAMWQVGVARQSITPFPGVELAGLGYYLNRTWDSILDDLNATALVISDDAGGSVAIVALDVLYIDSSHVAAIRNQAAAQTGLRPDSICINASHSHNAPTLAFFDGAGEVDPKYVDQVIRASVEALRVAWGARQPAKLRVGSTTLSGMAYNRTREGGPVDERLSVLCADALDGSPLAIAVNFHSHPALYWLVHPRAVSRDCAGQMVDSLEAAMPGATALYLQGSSGDVQYRLEYWTSERYREVGAALYTSAMRAVSGARPISTPGVRVATRQGQLPARRWTREEVMSMYEEGRHRLATGDTTGWLDGIASKMVGFPRRLPERYNGSIERAVEAVSRFAVRWGESVLPQLDTMPEKRAAEFQAMRIGDVSLVTNEAELFTSLALEIRRQWPNEDLFILGYSNGSISYLPDAYEVDRGSYASLQVPKVMRQLPFTREAGTVAVQESLAALHALDLHRGS